MRIPDHADVDLQLLYSGKRFEYCVISNKCQIIFSATNSFRLIFLIRNPGGEQINKLGSSDENRTLQGWTLEIEYGLYSSVFSQMELSRLQEVIHQMAP
jgi:hypothetical protein